MDSLTRSLIKPFLPESIDGREVTAVFGGGFKPPTSGHLLVIQKAIEDHPEIDNVIIYVGGKVRGGITQDQAFKVWDEHYKQLIDRPVRIEKSVAPIKDIYRYAKDNDEDIVYWVIGAREGREDDLQDIANRSSSLNKYPNLHLQVTATPNGGMSGTNARKALMSNNKEAFRFFIPEDVDYNEIWNILSPQPINESEDLGNYKEDNLDDTQDSEEAVNRYLSKNKKLHEKEGFDKNLGKDPFGLNQFAREIMQEEEESYDTFDYPKHIKSLTTFMLDKGMKLKPLPTVKFINDDVENAENFFGKTAYYDPNHHRIVLYTLNRHPKDVMRSFAHEMIHHMQNHEGKLETIHTQNTNEEGDLPEIEREAYEKGNMAFRGWTDTITEGVLKEGRYDTLTNQISRDIFTSWKEDFNVGDKYGIWIDSYEFYPYGIDVEAFIYFTPGLGALKVDGGSDISTGKTPAFIKVTFEIDPKMLPKFWEEVSMNLKDVVRHEIEHITQEGKSRAGKYTRDPKTDKLRFQGKDFKNDEFIRNLIDANVLPQADYFRLEKEIDAQLQGMYFRAKKEKRPFKDVLNVYLDAQEITPEEKEDILNLWRKRNKALGLPKF